MSSCFVWLIFIIVFLNVCLVWVDSFEQSVYPVLSIGLVWTLMVYLPVLTLYLLLGDIPAHVESVSYVTFLQGGQN